VLGGTSIRKVRLPRYTPKALILRDAMAWRRKKNPEFGLEGGFRTFGWERAPNREETMPGPEGAARAGLRFVAQALFVAVFLHALAAFVFCDFRLSLLFNGTHGFFLGTAVRTSERPC
jgi:hypothetical protein